MKNFHLNREDVVFTFIDIQDKLLKAMYNKDQIVKNSTVLAKVASTIGAEAIYTVQYPKGLGFTNEEVKAPLKDKQNCFCVRNYCSHFTKKFHSIFRVFFTS